MTSRQEYIIGKTLEQIGTIMCMLEDVMYRTDKLSEEEHERIREAHDLICQAKDRLF